MTATLRLALRLPDMRWIVALVIATAPLAWADPAPDVTAIRGQILGVAVDAEIMPDWSEGTSTWNVFDVLLFKNGWATRHFDALLDPGGPDADRAKHPKHWERWRKDADGFKLCTTRCRAIKYTKLQLNELAPKGIRIDGSYKSVAVGTLGGATSLRYAFWTFTADGRFSTSSAASVSAKGNHDTQVFSGGGAAKTAGGTYELDGPIATLRFDDGRVVYKTMVLASAKRDPVSVTINGTMFTRMK